MELKYFEPMYISAQNYSGFISHLAKAEGVVAEKLEHELRIRDILLRDFQSVASPENVRELYELATRLQQQVVKLTQSIEDRKQEPAADKSPFSPAKGPRIPAMKNVTASIYSNHPAFIVNCSIIQLPRGEYAYINGVGMRVLPYNATLTAIERAGYTATEAPL